MLVLTRKPGESLRIGDRVKIRVVALASGHVRLAIEAPDDVAIYREEVYERIEAANREAAKAPSELVTAAFQRRGSGRRRGERGK